MVYVSTLINLFFDILKYKLTKLLDYDAFQLIYSAKLFKLDCNL